MNKIFIAKLLLIVSMLSLAGYFLLSDILENFGYIDISVIMRMLFVFSLPVFAVVADEILKNKRTLRLKKDLEESLQQVRQHLKGATFVFDTNYLVTCAKSKNYLNNIFESDGITKIIPDFVIDELENFTKTPSTKAFRKKDFKKALEFLDGLPDGTFTVKDTTLTGDEGLFEVVNQYENAFLCTFDTALLNKIVSEEYDIMVLPIEMEMAFGINELY